MENLKKILLIEDCNSVREELSILLEFERYIVLEAVNGSIGYETALKYQPDLIISDVMMPELDGFDLLELLRGNPITSHIPFIFLSALGGKAVRRLAKELGADVYLQKPYEPNELIYTIKEYLKNRPVQLPIINDLGKLIIN